MLPADIPRHRLFNQHISDASFTRPADVVGWLGSVQAQDYLGALWAVGLRMRRAVESDIERALAEGSIVRTWPMRGTLHFVAAADVRWMLALMTPRIVARNASRLDRHHGVDAALVARCGELFVKALQGGGQLSRDGMYQVLEAAGIATAGQRGLHILWWLAQQGLLCFGAREGKQQTFVLLDEWLPEVKTLHRDEALAELTRRYFTGHGPATVHDFVWWSGLTVADATIGLDMAGSHLVRDVLGGRTYWRSPSVPGAAGVSPVAYLLPAYDEYTVAYKDRGAVLAPSYAKRAESGNGIFSPTMVIDGQVVGSWKRALKKGAVIITPNPFRPLKSDEKKVLAGAAGRYGAFLELPVVLEGL
jgi:hypothetical protein